MLFGIYVIYEGYKLVRYGFFLKEFIVCGEISVYIFILRIFIEFFFFLVIVGSFEKFIVNSSGAGRKEIDNK